MIYIYIIIYYIYDIYDIYNICIILYYIYYIYIIYILYIYYIYNHRNIAIRIFDDLLPCKWLNQFKTIHQHDKFGRFGDSFLNSNHH